MPNSMTLQELVFPTKLPLLESELLAALILKKPREYILTHPQLTVTPSTIRRYHQLSKKLLAGWPFAYLSGQKEFYSLNFKVSPAVLIPRPETEMTVDKVIETLKNLDTPCTVIDIGTGSGAIIIAASYNTKRLVPNKYRKTSFWATDISPAALRIAKQNASVYKLNKKIKFRLGNLLLAITAVINKNIDKEIIITANLPYLNPKQIKESKTIQKEPTLALDGGYDGLHLYRALFKQLKSLKKTKHLQLLCEIDPSQKAKMILLAQSYFVQAKIRSHKDLAGRWRLIEIKN